MRTMLLAVVLVEAVAQESSPERLRVPEWFAMFDPVDREIETRTAEKLSLSYSTDLSFGYAVGRYEGIVHKLEGVGFYYNETGTREGALFTVNTPEVFCEILIGHQQKPRVSLACERADYPDKSAAHRAFIDSLPKPPPPPPPGAHRIEYVIEGDCGWASLTLQNAGGGTEQHEVKLPAKYTMVAMPGTFLYISAQNEGDKGSVHVEIRVDGVIVRRSNATAPHGIASASGRL